MRSIPHPSIRTVREYTFQLATIITGILIALWVDGIVEERREQAVVRDAHAALGREIADNLRALSGSLPGLEKHEQQLRGGLQFANDLLSRGKTEIQEFRLQLNMPSLNSAGWQAAERTGALGLMEFADAKAYAEIYDLQEFVVQGQRQQVARIAEVTARFFAGDGEDPMSMRAQDLEAFRARVLDALGAVTVHRSLVTQLVEAYKSAPTK
jgi:hypothetical protein